MRTTKRVITLCFLVLALVLSMTVGAYADDSYVKYHGKNNFSFTFGPGTSMSETTLFNEFENVMPGDELNQNITVKNSSSEKVNIYVRAIPHDEKDNPLETVVKDNETIESMTEFLSALKMKVYYEGKLIYDSSPDKTAQLTENCFLGTFKSGETKKLTVTLTVPSELGNEHLGRMGEVDWLFTAEEIKDSGTSEKQTGDSMTYVFMAGTAFISLLLLIAAATLKRKNAER